MLRTAGGAGGNDGGNRVGEAMDFQPSSLPAFQPSSLPGRPAPGPDQRRSGFFESEGLARTFFFRARLVASRLAASRLAIPKITATTPPGYYY